MGADLKRKRRAAIPYRITGFDLGWAVQIRSVSGDSRVPLNHVIMHLRPLAGIYGDGGVLK